MKRILLLALVTTGLLLAEDSLAQSSGELVGMFDGRTPCQELANQLDEKTTPDCIKIKWRLYLYKDPGNKNEGNYELIGFVYKRGAPRKGRWHTSIGTKTNPAAIVIHLEEPGRPDLLLMKADENIFFFLDKDRNLMTGNRDFSYTLNRVPVKP